MERRHWDARSPKPGEHAHDFQVLDEAGRRTTLARLSGGGPLVLLFVKTHESGPGLRHLLEYRDATLSFGRLGARIACVSAAEPSLLAFFRAERGIGFPMLSDPRRHVIESWGLLDGRDQAAHAATFVLDAERIVRHRSFGPTAESSDVDAVLHFVRRGGAAPMGSARTAGAGRRLQKLWHTLQHALRPARLVR